MTHQCTLYFSTPTTNRDIVNERTGDLFSDIVLLCIVLLGVSGTLPHPSFLLLLTSKMPEATEGIRSLQGIYYVNFRRRPFVKGDCRRQDPV